MSAITCPKCSRINNLARTTCLYCGETLPKENLEALPLKPKLVQRVGASNHLVVLLPALNGKEYPDSIFTPAAVEKLTSSFHTDRYQMSSWLKVKCARVLKTVQEQTEAESLTQSALDAGFRVQTIANDDLRKLGYSFRGKSAELREDAWLFQGFDKNILKIDPKKTFLMVLGNIKVETRAPPGSKDKLDHESEVPTEDTCDYQTLDLFCQDHSTPALRLKNSRFDFRCLGNQFTQSSVLNFQTLTKLLKTRCAHMRVDESFRFVTPLLTDHTAGLFDPTTEHVSGSSSKARFQNNERQFDQYSRIICYLHHQAIAI